MSSAEELERKFAHRFATAPAPGQGQDSKVDHEFVAALRNDDINQPPVRLDFKPPARKQQWPSRSGASAEALPLGSAALKQLII